MRSHMGCANERQVGRTSEGATERSRPPTRQESPPGILFEIAARTIRPCASWMVMLDRGVEGRGVECIVVDAQKQLNDLHAREL